LDRKTMRSCWIYRGRCRRIWCRDMWLSQCRLHIATTRRDHSYYDNS